MKVLKMVLFTSMLVMSVSCAHSSKSSCSKKQSCSKEKKCCKKKSCSTDSCKKDKKS